MTLSRKESWSLLVMYGVFVVWMGLESVDLINLIVNFPPKA